MANTIMPTVFSSGVRRLNVIPGLHGWPMLGASSDQIAGMIADGYNPSVINSLSAAGATDAQLQNLWDTTAPGSQEFAVAANNLMQQLTGRPGATGGAGYPSAAIPSKISTAFGEYDLLQESSWNEIAGQFIQTQQQLNALAQRAPKDADVMDMVQNFNSLVGQYASYYQQAFGSAPSPIPFASIPTMSGLGELTIAATILIGMGIAMVTILGTLFLLNQRIDAKNVALDAGVRQSTTANQGTLIDTYNRVIVQRDAAYAAGNKALGDQLNKQAADLLAAIQRLGSGGGAGGSADFSTWFQRNWGWLMLGLGAMVIIPSALRRR